MRWSPEGELEPDEVEAALTACAQSAAVVFAERRQLTAYVVPLGDSLDTGRLRKRLADVLPQHLVPSARVVPDESPLTPNGKLPAPDHSGAGRAARRDVTGCSGGRSAAGWRTCRRNGCGPRVSGCRCWRCWDHWSPNA